MEAWLPALAVALPFLLALPAAYLGIAMKAAAGRVLAVAFVPALALIFFAPQALSGEPVRGEIAWVPVLNLNLAWSLDGFSILFALIVGGIGLLVMFYAASYLGRGERAGRFYSYLLLFGGAMLGLVLTDNLIALFAFWEITSITSFLLIGFWDSRKASQDGALKALLVTSLGGLALLAGTGVERGASGSDASLVGELHARVLLDPLGSRKFGWYGTVGLGVRAAESRSPRVYLLALGGVEGPRIMRGRLRLALEGGVGDGVRIGLAVRAARPGAR